MNIHDLADMRRALASDSLKRVDIRFDFSGVPDISSWVTIFPNTSLGAIFSDYQMEASHQGQYDAVALSSLANLVGIPEKSIVEMPMHVFIEGKLDGHDDILSLTMDNVSCQLTILCRNYTSIDDYIDWMLQLFDMLRRDNKMCRLRRMAIRKLDAFMSDNMDNLGAWLVLGKFYDEAIPLGIGYETCYEDKFTDYSSETPAFIINTRLFRVGQSGKQTVYQALVDLQANIDYDMVMELPTAESAKLKKLASSLNDLLFKLFLRYITPEYIDTHRK